MDSEAAGGGGVTKQPEVAGAVEEGEGKNMATEDGQKESPPPPPPPRPPPPPAAGPRAPPPQPRGSTKELEAILRTRWRSAQMEVVGGLPPLLE